MKYHELAKNLGQSEYVFDITSGNPDSEKIISAISQLQKNYDDERKIIRENLSRLQNYNCFDIIEEDIKRNDKNCS